MKNTIKLLFIFFLATNVNAQFMFRHTYGFGQTNEGKNFIQTFDHGYAIAGSTTPGWGGQTNFYLIKTDSLGNSEYHYSYGSNGIDNATGILQVADSGFILSGNSNGYNANSDYDICIMRIDKLGNLIWTKTFGTAEWDFTYDMDYSPDGNIILCGNSFGSGNGFSSGYAVKINIDGDVIWQKFINQNIDIYLRQIAIRNDGSFVVAGNSEDQTLNITDGFVAFLDSSGDTTKTVYVNTNKNESLTGVNFFSNGDLALCGTDIDTVSSNSDELIMRMDPNGNTVWYFSNFQAGTDSNNDIEVFNDTIITIGSTTSFGTGKLDFHIVEFNQNGAYIDANTYGGLEDEKGYKGLLSNDHGYVLLGTSTSYGPGSQSVLLIKSDTVFTEDPNITINTNELNYNNEICVFPNPVIDRINITSDIELGNLNFKIINLTGLVVFELHDKFLPTSIGPNLSSGLYFLILESKDFVMKKRLVIY